MSLWRALVMVTLPIFGGLVAACAGDPESTALVDAPADGSPATRPSGAPARAYPEGPYSVAVNGTLPDLAFDGILPNGAAGSVRLREHYTPRAARASLLVLRVSGGAWCGTCLWHVAHGRELLDGPLGERLTLVDLVVRGPDGASVRERDLAEFRAKTDTASRAATLADPSFALRGVAPASGAPMPLFVLVDRRTMKVVGYASNPAPEALVHQVESLLAAADGEAAPAPTSPHLVDDLFARNEWDLVRDMGAREPLPADPTNRVADDPRAAALGRAFFEDTAFSPSGRVACVTCHDPKKAFSDGLALPSGDVRGTRRTPRIRLAAYSRWQHWDGRFDSLWSQALAPFENADEIASSRVRVVRRVIEAYRAAYDEVFPDYPLPLAADLPSDGKPGDLAFERLPAERKEAVTRAFVNVGKALAAFERTFAYPTMRLDRYARGDLAALDAKEKAGLAVFFAAGCAQCHFGPRLTNDAFHVTRTKNAAPGDAGRFGGLGLLAAGEAGTSSRFSDARSPITIVEPPSPSTLGAFKTPALRGVAGGGPYGHAGTMKTLVEVAEHYGRGGIEEGNGQATGTLEPWLPVFDEAAQWSLAPFLESLRADSQ